MCRRKWNGQKERTGKSDWIQLCFKLAVVMVAHDGSARKRSSGSLVGRVLRR